MRSVVLDDNTSKYGTPEIQYPGPPGWGLAIEVTILCRKTNCHRIHNGGLMPHMGMKRVRTYLATRDNNFPASLVAPLEQINHIYTKSTPTHPSPLSPLCNTHTHLIKCTNTSTTLLSQDLWSDCTAGQMDGETGWWTTSGNSWWLAWARLWEGGVKCVVSLDSCVDGRSMYLAT